MRPPPRLALTVVAASLLTLPGGTAQARRASPELNVLAHVKGYDLVMAATQKGSIEDLDVELLRTLPGGATEGYAIMPVRSATSNRHPKRGHLDLGRNPRRATFAADLGRLGSVSLHFRQRGRAKRSLPAGCGHVVGRQRTRQGVVRGTLRLELGGPHFRTVVVHHARGILGSEEAFVCQHIDVTAPASLAAGVRAGRYVRLAAQSDDPYLLYQARHDLGTITVSEDGIRGDRRGRWWVYGEMTADAPASDFAYDIAHGTATLVGAAPLFTGTASWTGTADGTSPGTLTGDLTANWDLFGPQRVPGSAPSILEETSQGHL